jgi:hypothetical protein
MPPEPAYVQLVANYLHTTFPAGLACPLCGNRGWDVEEPTAAPVVPYPIPSPLPASPQGSLPLAPVTCTGCGHVLLFRATVVGVRQPRRVSTSPP